MPNEVQVESLNGFTDLMNFDEFLAGVVTAEMNDGCPTESLRAQAVASRSYALHRLQALGRANGRQAYSSNVGSLRRAAVTYTTKQILLYGGSVIQAFFSRSWVRQRGEPPGAVHTISSHDAVKWCKARSVKEGRTPAYYIDGAQTVVYRSGQVDVQNDSVKWNLGYRLPTEAEWEKAARGGFSWKPFPWGDTITHSQANYNSVASDTYGISPTRGFHPTFQNGGQPFTSPAGYFAANGYGLYDICGPKRYEDAVTAILNNMKVLPDKIHVERFAHAGAPTN